MAQMSFKHSIAVSLNKLNLRKTMELHLKMSSKFLDRNFHNPSFFSSTIPRSFTALILASPKSPIFTPKSSSSNTLFGFISHESPKANTLGANTPTPSHQNGQCQTSSTNTSASDTAGLATHPANSDSASACKLEPASNCAGPKKNQATK
ncbi:hypothetical protein VIGAN_01432800 [Vigna angularis var. angularis]|uniref:Uncharacterized protein n=1 Tax=Vigna angularis var. angularis TaxID=157739 RepID=A0A0S3R6T0_PHAAN|nr:hypothetical protein VIGAN_01432800 [Vigna angularis var. angularis]